MSVRPLLCAAASIAALLVSTQPALADGSEHRWEPLGPYGAEMSALAVAPSNARVLYAGTWTGRVYRSVNSGASWRDVTGGFPLHRPVNDIEVDPRNPAKAYAVVCDPEYHDKPAVGGLWATADGGQSWDLVESLGQCQVNDVAIDPRNPLKILAGTVRGFYQSTNGGTTWRQMGVNAGLENVTTVKFDPQTAGAVYAIDYDAGFARSTNGGTSWTVRNNGLIDQQRLNGLSISVAGPKTLFVHFSSFHWGPIYRSLDGGLTWSSASRGLPPGPPGGSLYVTDIVAAAAPQRFYASTYSGLFVSANQGKTWQAVPTPLRQPRRLAIPGGGQVMYVGDAQGLLKSVDRGLTWVEINRGLPPLQTDSLIVAPSSEDVLYLSSERHSVDAGVTWSRDGDAHVMAVHPSRPRVALGAVAGGVGRSRDAGATWLKISSLGCLVPQSIEIDPETPTNVYLTADAPIECGGAPPCASLRSSDGGVTWSCMGDLPQRIGTLKIAPSQPSTLYAIGGYPVQQIFKTVNGGISWQAVKDLNGIFVFGLSVSPDDPDRLYATLDRVTSTSTDGGATWSPLAGLPSEAVVVPSSEPSVLYAYAYEYVGGERLILSKSLDAGASWSPVSLTGLPSGPGTRIQRLVVSPVDPSTLFAATQAGIYRLRAE